MFLKSETTGGLKPVHPSRDEVVLNIELTGQPLRDYCPNFADRAIASAFSGSSVNARRQ